MKIHFNSTQRKSSHLTPIFLFLVPVFRSIPCICTIMSLSYTNWHWLKVGGKELFTRYSVLSGKPPGSIQSKGGSASQSLREGQWLPVQDCTPSSEALQGALCRTRLLLSFTGLPRLRTPAMPLSSNLTCRTGCSSQVKVSHDPSHLNTPPDTPSLFRPWISMSNAFSPQERKSSVFLDVQLHRLAFLIGKQLGKLWLTGKIDPRSTFVMHAS